MGELREIRSLFSRSRRIYLSYAGSRLESSLVESGLKRISLLFTQPDFKTNPVRAVWRRVRWRLHWRTYPHDPVLLNNWCNGIGIILPRSGSAAQIFYREFSSPGVV